MAYGQRGGTGFDIPQTRAGAFGATPTLTQPQAPQQPAFQQPTYQPQQQTQPKPQAAPTPQPAFLPQAATTSQNVMAQNLPQVAPAQAAPVATTAQPAAPAAAKPQYDPYMLANMLFSYAPQSAAPVALRGGGVMNTMRGGYNLDDVRTAALKDPNAFLSSLKNAYSSPDQSWNNYTSILGDTKKGSGNGFATLAGSAPDFLREMIKGYDKPAEAPKAAAPVAETPKTTTQDPLTTEQQQMDDYYNQITKGYQDQLNNYKSQFDSLNNAISQLTNQNTNNQTISQAIEPQNLPVVRPYEMARPGDLNDFLNGLSDVQQRTALATKGAQGGGINQDDQNYFLNMIMRTLIGDNGQMGNLEDLTPIEQQYLGLLGLPTADEQAFLKALKSRGIYSA